MSYRKQFKRSVAVRFGPKSAVSPFESGFLPSPVTEIGSLDDDGIRVSFDLSRTSSGVPDRGFVRLWNLTGKTSDSIVYDHELLTSERTATYRAANGPPRIPDDVLASSIKAINEGYQITVMAGYQRKPEKIFIGEYVNVNARKRVSPIDFVTEITLGDTFTSLRDGFLSQPLGLGVTIPQLIQEFSDATGIRTSQDAATRIAAVAPTASITLFQNGAMGGIRAAEAMDGISDLLDHTWFVRDGELYLLPEGQAIQDFSIVLQQGVDILDFSSSKGFNDIEVTALMNGRIEPGRGVLIRDESGLPVGNALGYVVRDARYVGDTHSDIFTTTFTASAAQVPIPGAIGDFF